MSAHHSRRSKAVCVGCSSKHVTKTPELSTEEGRWGGAAAGDVWVHEQPCFLSYEQPGLHAVTAWQNHGTAGCTGVAEVPVVSHVTWRAPAKSCVNNRLGTAPSGRGGGRGHLLAAVSQRLHADHDSMRNAVKLHQMAYQAADFQCVKFGAVCHYAASRSV